MYNEWKKSNNSLFTNHFFLIQHLHRFTISNEISLLKLWPNYVMVYYIFKFSVAHQKDIGPLVSVGVYLTKWSATRGTHVQFLFTRLTDNMATLTLGDGREGIVEADRALKEGGQVRVTAPRSSCRQKQTTIRATKNIMDHNYLITTPVNFSIYMYIQRKFKIMKDNTE